MLGEASADVGRNNGRFSSLLFIVTSLMWDGYGLLSALVFWLVNGAVNLALSVDLLPGGSFNTRGGFFVGFLPASCLLSRFSRVFL